MSRLNEFGIWTEVKEEWPEGHYPAIALTVDFVVVGRLPFKNGQLYCGYYMEGGGSHYWKGLAPSRGRFEVEEVAYWRKRPGFPKVNNDRT